MSSVWSVRRSATDAKLGGVCGGIAEQWGVDPVLVRVGAVLLGLSGGIGVVLYAAGWLMVPVAGEQRTHLDDLFPKARSWPLAVKVLIVAVACVVGAGVLAPVLPFGFGSALVLAAIWYFGYYKHRAAGGRATGGGPAAPGTASTAGTVGGLPGAEQAGPQYDYFTFTGPRTPFTQAAQAWQERMRDYERGFPAPGAGQVGAAQAGARQADRAAFFAVPDPVGLYAPAPAAGATSRTDAAAARAGRRALTRPARRLRLVAVIVLGLTMSGIALASSMGLHVGLTTYLAAALLVAGLTLVAAAWVGRARGILPVAVLLAVATMISAVGTSAPARDGVGIENLSYTDGTTIPATQDWSSGALTVDLSQVRVTSNRTVALHVDSGALTVIAPPTARIRVVGRIDDGMLRIGAGKGRWGSELTGTADPAGTTGPLLTVDASVDSGLLEVRR